MSDKKDPAPGNPKNKPSAAVFIWLIVFIGLISLFVMRSSSMLSSPREWTQSEFVSHLQAGEIVSANLIPESDNVYFIEGIYQPAVKSAPKDPGSVSKDLRTSSGSGSGNGLDTERELEDG